MATRTSYARFSSPDIVEPVKLIKRDRTMRMVGALGSLGLMMAGLFAFPYLSFRETIDPGPAQSALFFSPQDTTDEDPAAPNNIAAPPTDQPAQATDQPQNMPTPSTDQPEDRPVLPGDQMAPPAQIVPDQGTTRPEPPPTE